MTPTQQDNELRAEVKQILKDGFNYYIGERKDVSSDMKPLDTYCTEHLMQLITADRKRVALEARIDELPFLKGMKETSASLLEDGSGDFVRVQDLDTRLGDWINELEMLTQQRKEK